MNDQLEGMIKIKNAEFKPSKKALNNFLKGKRLNYWWNENEESRFLDLYMDYWFNYELKKYGVFNQVLSPLRFLTGPISSLCSKDEVKFHFGA